MIYGGSDYEQENYTDEDALRFIRELHRYVKTFQTSDLYITDVALEIEQSMDIPSKEVTQLSREILDIVTQPANE